MHLPMIKKQVAYYLIAQSTAAFCYYAAMAVVTRKAVTLPTTYFDGRITFHTLWAYVYLSFFFLVLLSILGSPVATAKKCMMTVILNAGLAFIFFICFPTRVPDVYYQHTAVTSSPIIAWIRGRDQNLNCFPSLHIANALAAVYFLNNGRHPLIKTLCWIWFALIAWSVLSTKQHCFYDIVGGTVLAAVSLTFVKRFTKKFPGPSVSAPKRVGEIEPG
jgi:membrane-associated phospholipid phosphatase